MSQPLISIITVCLNSEEFIESCIQSVISQKYTDFEYIIIDGGSNDRTVDIIKKYNAKIFYWHSKPDRSLSHAFNQGIEHSSGKWLLFLNSDDYLASSEVLSNIAPYLSNNTTTDVVYGQLQLVDRQQDRKLIGSAIGANFNWKKYIFRGSIPHPAAFTSRKLFDSHGQFSEDYHTSMDYELFLRAGPEIRTVFVPIIISYMRTGGISRRYIMKSLNEWRKAHSKNKTMPYPLIWIIFFILIVRTYSGLAYNKIYGKFN